jgi:hypothetical protein
LARFHRIVANNPPKEADFMSKEALGHGRPRSVTPESWAGVSTFDSLEAARNLAKALPRLGEFVAILEVPDHVVRVKSGSAGHYDLYAGPEELLGYVEETVAVECAKGEEQ